MTGAAAIILSTQVKYVTGARLQQCVCSGQFGGAELGFLCLCECCRCNSMLRCSWHQWAPAPNTAQGLVVQACTTCPARTP